MDLNPLQRIFPLQVFEQVSCASLLQWAGLYKSSDCDVTKLQAQRLLINPGLLNTGICELVNFNIAIASDGKTVVVKVTLYSDTFVCQLLAFSKTHSEVS